METNNDRVLYSLLVVAAISLVLYMAFLAFEESQTVKYQKLDKDFQYVQDETILAE